MRSLFQRHFKEIPAVQEVSFEITEGEVVGFLGPNGAGKTTTLKMLSGLLYPTSGEARVLGHIPSRRESSLLSAITLVMGNRSQLVWDIPAADSMRVLQAIFQLPEERYRRTLGELSELLELEPLMHKPVRNLSLGERMKVEFAAALIHEPRVLFLDEPTIGLDVSMQVRIRHFVAEYNHTTGATILLTSHHTGGEPAGDLLVVPGCWPLPGGRLPRLTASGVEHGRAHRHRRDPAGPGDRRSPRRAGT